jgi:hypothetical protein
MLRTTFEWEQKAVAFVDILGFASLVSHDQGKHEIMATVEAVLAGLLSEESGVSQHADMEGSQTTAVSDSLFLSERPDNTLWLLARVAGLQLTLLRRGILVRGGVCSGRLRHRDRLVFGPAVVSAYQLERKAASFPRVLVSSHVCAEALAQERQLPQWRHFHGFGVRPISILEQASDGLWAVNPFFRVPREGLDGYGQDRWILKMEREVWEALRHRIQFETTQAPSPRQASIVGKVRWAVDQFNRNCTMVERLPWPDDALAGGGITMK